MTNKEKEKIKDPEEILRRRAEAWCLNLIVENITADEAPAEEFVARSELMARIVLDMTMRRADFIAEEKNEA